MSILSQWIAKQVEERGLAEILTEENFNAWRKSYLMEAIMGIRYGQSFCNRFGVEDYVLYYMRDVASAHQYILKNYLQGNPNDKETKPGPV